MPDPAKSALKEEALEWLVQLNFGMISGTEFQAWRARSPEHEAAARAAETLWQDIGQTRTAVEFASKEAARQHSGTRTLSAQMRWPVRIRHLAMTTAIAATIVLVVAGTGIVGPMAGLLADHSTRPGEQQRVELPDGSTAYLNTATALSITFTPSERRIDLSYGEAYFDVIGDPDRPFVVAARTGEARAVGTAFAVRTEQDAVRVTVSEGIVEVSANAAPPVRLSAGQGAAYGDGLPVPTPYAVNEQAATAWRRGKLIFNQRPLAEVADELSRYSTGRVLVASDRLRGLPVTGVFDLDDPDGMLLAIERSLPVTILRLPWLTVLR